MAPRLVFMRHSSRLDLSVPGAVWEDSATRPHDSPIDDFALPAAVAARLAEAGFRFSAVWSSPYRRCLQTAAVVLRTLTALGGVAEAAGAGAEAADVAAAASGGGDTPTEPAVHVHHGLGETTNAARKCFRAAGVDESPLELGTPPMYLTAEAKAAALGAGIRLLDVNALHFNDNARGGFVSRLTTVVREICAAEVAKGVEGDVLFVTHGDALSSVCGILAKPTVLYEAGFCGVVAVDHRLTRVLFSDGVSMLDSESDADE